MSVDVSESIKVFCSYAPKDESLSKELEGYIYTAFWYANIHFKPSVDGLPGLMRVISPLVRIRRRSNMVHLSLWE